MFIRLMIQLNLWQRSRENPIYEGLIPLLVPADVAQTDSEELAHPALRAPPL